MLPATASAEDPAAAPTAFTVDAVRTPQMPYDFQLAYTPTTFTGSSGNGGAIVMHNAAGMTTMTVVPPVGQQFVAGTTYDVAPTADATKGPRHSAHVTT